MLNCIEFLLVHLVEGGVVAPPFWFLGEQAKTLRYVFYFSERNKIDYPYITYSLFYYNIIVNICIKKKDDDGEKGKPAKKIDIFII